MEKIGVIFHIAEHDEVTKKNKDFSSPMGYCLLTVRKEIMTEGKFSSLLLRGGRKLVTSEWSPSINLLHKNSNVMLDFKLNN